MRRVARHPTVRFAAELRTRRGARSLRSVARDAGISAGYLSDLEAAKRRPTPAVLARLGATLGAEAEVPRWNALCGRVPVDIEAALVAHPERWDAVRAALELPVPAPVDAPAPRRVGRRAKAPCPAGTPVAARELRGGDRFCVPHETRIQTVRKVESHPHPSARGGGVWVNILTDTGPIAYIDGETRYLLVERVPGEPARAP